MKKLVCVCVYTSWNINIMSVTYKGVGREVVGIASQSWVAKSFFFMGLEKGLVSLLVSSGAATHSFYK